MTRNVFLLCCLVPLLWNCKEQESSTPISAEANEICVNKKADFPTVANRIENCLDLMYPNRREEMTSTVDASRIKIKFSDNENYYEVYFSTKGKWISTEVKMPPINLPKRIKVALGKSEYQNWEIGKIKLFQTTKSLAYQVEVGKRLIGTDRYVLLFNEKNEIISEKKK